MKATAFLKKDHEAVKKLFQNFEGAGERKERKQHVFERIKAALDRHAQVEEEIFYPALRAESEESKDDEAKDLVLEAQEEHNVMKSLLSEIDGMSPSDEQYDAKMKVLRENVEHHIEEEESEMFPKAERHLGDRLDELGAALAAREAALEKPATTRLVDTVKTLIFGGDSDTSGSKAPRRRRATAKGRGPRAGGGRKRGRAAHGGRSRSAAAKRGGRGSAANGRKQSSARAKTGARRGRAASRSNGGRDNARTNGRRRRATVSAAKATTKRRSARAGVRGAAARRAKAIRGRARQTAGRRRESGSKARRSR